MLKNFTNTFPKIIGVTGTFGSGKDSLCEYLVKKYGYLHVPTRETVQEFALQKYNSTERPILYKTANELRDAYGAGILSQLALFSFTKSAKNIKESA